MDVRVTYLYENSQVSNDLVNILTAHKKTNKNRYIDICLEQQQNFSPFVVLADIMVGAKASILVISLQFKFS